MEDYVEPKGKDIVSDIAKRIKDRHETAIISLKITVSSLWQILRWARYGQKLEKIRKRRKNAANPKSN